LEVFNHSACQHNVGFSKTHWRCAELEFHAMGVPITEYTTGAVGDRQEIARPHRSHPNTAGVGHVGSGGQHRRQDLQRWRFVANHVLAAPEVRRLRATPPRAVKSDWVNVAGLTAEENAICKVNTSPTLGAVAPLSKVIVGTGEPLSLVNQAAGALSR
jgi:hypothetical protein